MANIITCLRILCGIILTFCTPFSTGFYLTYIIGGLSDILDGFVARRFHLESKLGAKLDTIADIIFVAVILVKILGGGYIPMWVILWTIGIAVIKGINIACGFVIRKKFVAEHTVLNKISGALVFALPLYLNILSGKMVEALMALTCILATLAAIQEGHYIRTGKEIE